NKRAGPEAGTADSCQNRSALMISLAETAILLAAAVVAVSLFRFARLSSILGYLAAGLVIGPWGLNLIGDIARIMQVSEFGILLFQDLAVLPALALLPLLAPLPGSHQAGGPWWAGLLKLLAVIAVVIGGGRLLLRPALRVVARVRVGEVFTAAALLTVIATALVANLVGLSMALGAFLAGVLLADSEFRHELEADLEPFKGLLLGLFFV